jgi:hypothetical protein
MLAVLDVFVEPAILTVPLPWSRGHSRSILQHLFEVSMATGAATVFGIPSVSVVNTVMFAPDRRPRLVALLAAIHRGVRKYANGSLPQRPSQVEHLPGATPGHRGAPSRNPASNSGAFRSASGRSVAVGLVAELQAAGALNSGCAHAATLRAKFRREASCFAGTKRFDKIGCP